MGFYGGGGGYYGGGSYGGDGGYAPPSYGSAGNYGNGSYATTGYTYVTANPTVLPSDQYTTAPSQKGLAIEANSYIATLEDNSIAASKQGSPHEEGFEVFTDAQGNTMTVTGTPVGETQLKYENGSVPSNYDLEVQFHTHPDGVAYGAPDTGDANGLAQTNTNHGGAGIGIVVGQPAGGGSGDQYYFYGPGSGSTTGH